MRPRYVDLLGDALKIEPSSANYLSDIDAGYYVSAYLRSWAFEAQMRDHLRTRYGNEWFTSAKAGAELRELWSEGQKFTAEDLLKDATGSGLELEAVADRIRADVRIVAFTATQIPNIDGRLYPPELAGPHYPEGIPIRPEGELERVVRDERIDEVVFSYSDVSHEHVMHLASK